MIIVDFNQVCISNLMAQVGNHTDLVVEEDLVRHMILNSLRTYKQKFGRVYGKMVIACDDKNYWRKQIFPFYKASRKKSREESDIDWVGMFEVLNKIRQEVKDNLPYTVIQVDNCEADDIIATICTRTTEDIIILSADKDFIQLHRENVIQFDPIRKRNVQVENPSRYLKELIIRGDSGDGVPNALSPGNSFVDGIKQKSVRSNKLEVWLDMEWDELRKIDELKDGIDRNKQLIDLFEIPDDIKEKIWSEYLSQTEVRKRTNILGYLQQHRLKSLIENINDFL